MVTKGLDALFWWRKVPFTCADVYACLEGEYSTWTQKNYSPINDAYITNRFVVYIDDAQEIALIVDSYGNSLKKLDLSDGSLTTLLSTAALSWADVDLDPSNKYASVLHEYIVALDSSTDPYTLRVYRHGSLVFSFQLPTATSSVSVSISPRGKWIIIIDDTNNKYYVLEGS